MRRRKKRAGLRLERDHALILFGLSGEGRPGGARVRGFANYMKASFPLASHRVGEKGNIHRKRRKELRIAQAGKRGVSFLIIPCRGPSERD